MTTPAAPHPGHWTTNECAFIVVQFVTSHPSTQPPKCQVQFCGWHHDHAVKCMTCFAQRRHDEASTTKPATSVPVDFAHLSAASMQNLATNLSRTKAANVTMFSAVCGQANIRIGIPGACALLTNPCPWFNHKLISTPVNCQVLSSNLWDFFLDCMAFAISSCFLHIQMWLKGCRGKI